MKLKGEKSMSCEEKCNCHWVGGCFNEVKKCSCGWQGTHHQMKSGTKENKVGTAIKIRTSWNCPVCNKELNFTFACFSSI